LATQPIPVWSVDSIFISHRQLESRQEIPSHDPLLLNLNLNIELARPPGRHVVPGGILPCRLGGSCTCTLDAPLHPGAPSGNGPIPNFWTPCGLRARLPYYPPIHVSLVFVFSFPFSKPPRVSSHSLASARSPCSLGDSLLAATPCVLPRSAHI
jgi:hypothetical protein